jgi:serine/threonine protein kinase
VRSTRLDNPNPLLHKLDLLEIEGFRFHKDLGGGSALTSLYINGEQKVVFKFLISPRNYIELERFKLEYSVLERNKCNFCRQRGKVPIESAMFLGPVESYPLPIIKFPLQHRLDDAVSFFGYEFYEGQLLSQVITDDWNLHQKVSLLYRLSSALNYFNRTNYSHRDLHPSNILLLKEPVMFNNPYEAQLNNPKVKFLDLGSCQRVGTEHDWLWRIDRGIDEDAVFKDNNRRVLSSFVSMPPDFLDKGENTVNYDTWAFGVYAYNLLFNELPFEAQQIGDITKLRVERDFKDTYISNLKSLDLGLAMIIKHLLSPLGEERPSSDAIVRLFSWVVSNDCRFTERLFIKKVIHQNGNDPDYVHDE